MSPPRLLLLGRPECHLCEAFRAEFEAEFAGRLGLESVDVDSRADWREQYGRLIPVLLDADGAPVCLTRFDADAVRGRFPGF